jgi:HPt (histidine-containing phosphotransfer) domain-containing protein/CHASE3 domain sensor protein
MKLTLRFLLLIGALLCALGASTVAGLRALETLDVALQGVVDVDMERMLAVTHVRRLFRSQVVLERDYILTSSESERHEMDAKVESLAADLEEQLARYRKVAPPEDRAALDDIAGVKQRWLALNAEVRRAAVTGSARALELAKQHGKDPVSWEKVISGLITLNEHRLAEQVAHTHQAYADARRMLLSVSLVTGVLAAGLGWLVFLGIRSNVREVVALNTNLEELVRQRTLALAARERSLKLVLDSTGDALLSVDRAGRLSPECSRAAQTWFGLPQAGGRVADYLLPDNPALRAQFDLGFEQLTEDVLPWEVTVDQLPKRVRHRDLLLELDYKQVLENGEFSGVVIVARDVTARVGFERADRDAREQQALIAKLLEDKAGFAQFVKDSDALVTRLAASADRTIMQRDLHTLKGNVAMYGLGSLAQLCHEVEDRMAETEGLASAEDTGEIAALWQSKLAGIEEFLTRIGSSTLEVPATEHVHLLESLLQRRDYEEILTMVELWAWTRISERLARLRAQTEYVASRLGKSVHVTIDDGDVRLPGEYLEEFWPTLIHVVRNAVDHGLEDPELRRSLGKSPEGHLQLTATQDKDHLQITIADDGPGIDRAALLESARRKGLDVADDASLADLVFADGVSSRTAVTEMSGRGVGLPAVLRACQAAGGTAEVTSINGRGTTVTFRFRRPVIKRSKIAAALERRWTLAPVSSGVLEIRDGERPRAATRGS